MSPLLLCTDLDRTLIPNGREPESPGARERFRRFVTDQGVTLAYVSGRHRALVEQAIRDYALPLPDYVIGDVGTSLYRVREGSWSRVSDWEEIIGADWAGLDRGTLAACFEDLPGLRLQEPEKQNRFKLSYYAPADLQPAPLLGRMRERLATTQARASLVWSVDEAAGVGLLDVLPEGATKYHAVVFLMGLTGHDESSTLFAGDSGNDLEVLASRIPSVLVANGHPAVRSQAQQLAEERGCADRLYQAVGGWGGMNGNYSAGILEGVAHFHPELLPAA
ncbi:MAG: HAD-IIB family hydrolase [Bdellovibrio bacteriovorus]